jgi:benzoate/toluate 1,2-dioxygenase reductase component
MRPQSPCVVEFDYPMSAIRRGPAPVARRATIVDIVWQTDDVIEVMLQSDDKKPFNFLPGQYANLQIPDTSTVRSYSFVNRPGSDGATFLVRLIKNGVMSQWLRRQSSSHASLLVTGPLGRFFLRDPGRPLLFVAGGTGVGPIISILDSMRSAGMAPPCVTLIFGVNSSADLFHRHTLEALIGSFSAGKLVITAMSPDPTWDGAKGTAVDALDAIEIVPGGHAYLCGPPAMVQRAEAALTMRGLDIRSIFAEIFLPTAETRTA